MCLYHSAVRCQETEISVNRVEISLTANETSLLKMAVSRELLLLGCMALNGVDCGDNDPVKTALWSHFSS